MLSKSALAGGGQNRCPQLEVLLGLNGGFFGAFFFNLPIGAENASGAFGGLKMLSGVEKNRPRCFELTDPGVHVCTIL